MSARKEAERAAWAALDSARLTVVEHGQKLPCEGHWADFTAESVDTRREAAQRCFWGCPLFEACAAVRPYVSWGVWAGVVVPEDQPKAKRRSA